MTTAFRLLSFEAVETGGRSVLLRLSAEGGPLALLADDGRRARELMPVPDPSSADHRARPWSGAFAADRALLGGRPAFAARTGDGMVIDLPAPQERSVRRAAPPAAAPARLSAAHLSEARRHALLVVQRDLDVERSQHAEVRAEAHHLRIELTRARSVISRLSSELEQTRAELEEAQLALEAAREEVSRLGAALTAARAKAGAQEERATAQLSELTARLEAETASHIASASRSAEERQTLESDIAAARGALEEERETAAALRAESAQIAAARADAERRVGEHLEALTIFEGALDAQIEQVAAAEVQIGGLEDEREADTQVLLRLVRSARANDLGAGPARSPFPRWERTRHRLSRWPNGEGDQRDEDPVPTGEDHVTQT